MPNYGRNAAKWAKIAAGVPANWPEAKAKDPVFKGETDQYDPIYSRYRFGPEKLAD